MTQQKAASLTSNLFARKGKASPAGALISEMEAAGTEGFDPSGRDAATGAKARVAGLNGAAGRRKPKAPAELPLLAFVEAQPVSGEGEPAAEAASATAAEVPPAASLLERGVQSLRRTNGHSSAVPAAPCQAAPQPAASGAAAANAGDADIEDSIEAETVSGDANVAAIEDAPQDEEGCAEGPADAVIVEAAAPATDDAAADDAVIVEPEADRPAAGVTPAAERSLADLPAMPASLALRQATALQHDSLAPDGVRPSPRLQARGEVSKARPPHTLPWRSAAVVALGAALGLGFYLVLAGKPAEPPVVTAAVPEAAASPAVPEPAPAAPVAAAADVAAPAVEAALPEPSFDIIRIEPDGQSIVAGRAEPFSEWILLNNGSPIASVRADANGEWVVLPDASLVPGANAFSLVPKTERGKVAIPAPAGEPPAGEAQVPVPPRSDAGSLDGALQGAPGHTPARSGAVALPKAKPVAQAAAGFRVSPDGDYEVQLASVRQTADAERERGRLAAAFPDLLGRMDLGVREAALEGAGTFYRIRSGAIADLGIARELCRRLEAVGQGCLVVRRAEGTEAAAVEAEVVEELPEAAVPVRQQAERPQ
jgi:hypothetical protein